MFHLYATGKRQKTKGFMTFLGGIEMDIGLKWVKIRGNRSQMFYSRHLHVQS